jgi:hypothetical protein
LENEDDDMSFDQQCENLQVWSAHYELRPAVWKPAGMKCALWASTSSVKTCRYEVCIMCKQKSVKTCRYEVRVMCKQKSVKTCRFDVRVLCKQKSMKS